ISPRIRVRRHREPSLPFAHLLIPRTQSLWTRLAFREVQPAFPGRSLREVVCPARSPPPLARYISAWLWSHRRNCRYVSVQGLTPHIRRKGPLAGPHLPP